MIFQVVFLVFVATVSSFNNLQELTILDIKEQRALASITLGANRFAVNLYQVLARERAGNVFVSPVSVQMILALAAMGAGGNTARELVSLLTLPSKSQETLVGYSSLLKTLSSKSIVATNELFLSENAIINQGFRNYAEGFFRATPKYVNFQGDLEYARQTINSMVKHRSGNMVKNILQPGSVNSHTNFVLVSAVYFKDTWRQPSSYIKPGKFFVSERNHIYVPMVHFDGDFNFAYDPVYRANIIEIKFNKMFLSMIIILPDEISGLPKLERGLESMSLLEKLVRMPKRRVNVVIPKFSLEDTVDLKSSLQSLGIHDIFDDRVADFSGLTNTPLSVSKIVQKAMIKIDEQGLVVATRSGGRRRKTPPYGGRSQFIANHPFIFFIQYDGNILFFGRITELPSI